MRSTATGQSGPSTELLKSTLLRDSMQVEETGFSFNNLNLANTSGNKLDLEINIITPDFIEIISGKDIRTTLDPAQNKILPFRFQFSRKSIPVAWYAVRADIRINQTGEIIKKVFFIKPKENNNWKASLRQPNLTFTSSDKEVVFELLIQNTGNSPDVFKVSFVTDLRLDLPKKNISIELPPGSKIVVPVRILLNPKESQFIVREGVDVTIKSKTGDQKLMQQFISLIGNMYTGSTERWNKMPLTLELNLQNLASTQPFAYLNATGSIKLNEKSRLSIQYHSDHYYKAYALNAQLARVEYQHGRMTLGLGSVVDFNNFLVDGNGARFSYVTKDETSYEITGAKGRTGLSQYYNARISSAPAKRLSVSTNIIANQDRSNNLNSYLALNRADLNIDKTTRLSIEVGGGMEDVTKAKLDTSLKGYQYGYLLDKTGKNFQLRSNITNYSKNFPGFNKGFQYQLHELRWFSKSLFAGAYLENNYRSYNYAKDSSVNFLFNMRSSEYGVRTGWRLDKGSIVFSPGILKQRQDSIDAPEAKMYKLALNANYQFNENISLSLYSTAGHVIIENQPKNVGSFNSITNLMTLQASLYGLSFRYDNGPYYYYEMKQYLSQPTKLQRIQVSPFMELPMRKLHLSYRLQLNYMHEVPNATDLLLVYNNLQYSSYKKGLDVGVTGQWNIRGTQDPFINIVIRKKLKVPVIVNKNSASISVRLYLDKNADGKFNGDDEPVEGALVSTGEAMVMTDKNGTISFKNIERKTLRLDLGGISHLRGWIPKGGYVQVITPGASATYNIPFSKSRVVSGNLLLTRDSKSSLTMELDAIRLTAVSSTGETYNAFTNAAGEFFFNLPADNFTININQGIFDDNFRPVETTKLADLINNDELKLQFEIRQKKRQLNLHKQ